MREDRHANAKLVFCIGVCICMFANTLYILSFEANNDFIIKKVMATRSITGGLSPSSVNESAILDIRTGNLPI